MSVFMCIYIYDIYIYHGPKGDSVSDLKKMCFLALPPPLPLRLPLHLAAPFPHPLSHALAILLPLPHPPSYSPAPAPSPSDPSSLSPSPSTSPCHSTKVSSHRLGTDGGGCRGVAERNGGVAWREHRRASRRCHASSGQSPPYIYIYIYMNMYMYVYIDR